MIWIVVVGTAAAASVELSAPQQRELLSAILCIDVDAAAQAKAAIADAKRTARESGGGVVDLSAIKRWQDDHAEAKKEEAAVRRQLAALKSKPLKCEDVARAYNCINNRCDQVSCEADLCDLNLKPASVAIDAMRTNRNVESSRRYTFTAPSR